MSQDRDFVIELDGQPASYRLHVSSLAGDATMDVGLDPARLGVDLDTLQARVLASAAKSRSMRVPELEQPLRQVGQALFEAVFQASAGALFLSSRDEVERAGGRLRIVLRLHPPELAVLPWELLFSEHYGGYLCRRSPMVRYVDAPEPVRPLTVTPPLRVLGMTALPGDLAALDADTEQRRLQQLLAPLQARGLITVDWVPGQSWDAAQDALYAGCHVFHFIGHGGFDPDRGEGVIAFADERGRRQLVGASALADLLSVADPMPRLVVLSSCQTAAGADTDVFSSTAATLVRTVPGVVAMQFAVTDDAAAVFSRTFYQALVHNRGVDEAVRAGRIALLGWNPDTLEWVTPVLYLRSRETRLFDLTDPGSAPREQNAPARNPHFIGPLSREFKAASVSPPVAPSRRTTVQGEKSMLFLSYAEEDCDSARKISEWFRRQEIDVFKWEDEGRQSGQLIRKIEQAINRANAFIALMSPDFVKSPWCHREAELAILHEVEMQRSDPDSEFIRVLRVKDTSHLEAGFLASYDLLDVTTEEKMQQVLPGIVRRFARNNEEFPDYGDTRPELISPSFRNRGDGVEGVAEAQTKWETQVQAPQLYRPKIFLCYRREDTQGFARGIYENLSGKYGHEQVFRDIDSTPAGVRYSTWIESRVGQCNVLIVLIGGTWLSAKDRTGQRRLDLPKDWVRQEIEAALRRDIPIIPVRVQGAPMPPEDELPASIADLAGFQSAEVTDSRWAYDIGQLIRAIDNLIATN